MRGLKMLWKCCVRWVLEHFSLDHTRRSLSTPRRDHSHQSLWVSRVKTGVDLCPGGEDWCGSLPLLPRGHFPLFFLGVGETDLPLLGGKNTRIENALQVLCALGSRTFVVWQEDKSRDESPRTTWEAPKSEKSKKWTCGSHKALP